MQWQGESPAFFRGWKAVRFLVMKISLRPRNAVVLGGLLIALATVAYGRNDGLSKVSCVVVDPTDAAIPKAHVVFNSEAGTATVNMGDDGSATVELPSGRYQLTISSPGFRTTEVKDFLIEAPTPATLKVRLLGGGGSRFVISDEAPLVPSEMPESEMKISAEPAGTKKFVMNWEAVQEAKVPLANETHLSAGDRALLERELVKQYKGESDSAKLAAETRIALVDLNGDGNPEIVAQAVGSDYCGGTGNCWFWVFQKGPSGYRIILERGAAQGFAIQPERTSGYFDLVLTMHGSATEQGLYLYQFKQGRYRRAGCYEANWTYLDKSGEVRELKEPRITACR